MSSRCCLSSRLAGLVVGVQVAEDDAGQAAFEATEGFGRRVAGGEPPAVLGLAEAVYADLSDGDAVQRGVELSVA